MTRLPLLLLVLASCVSLSRAADRPNILFLICDDASMRSFGAYGSTDVATPNFDRIAREGVLFRNAYNCNPKCAPARACLLTGRYSWQLEEACNHNPFLSAKWKFFPYLLEDDGYQIGLTGKGWGPGIWKGVDQGKAQSDNPAGHPWQKRKMKPPHKGMSSTDYAGNFADFLAARDKEKPFSFWLGTKEPHRGYEKGAGVRTGRDLSEVTVPKFWPDNDQIRGDLADYAIEVEWYDKHIGLALKALEKEGLLKSTLVIATSDHGMPFPRVKGQLYEEGFHVPFAAMWKGRVPAGRTVTDFISFPDLAPTLLEVTGMEPHPQMTGQSFLSQLLTEAEGRIDPARDFTVLGKERHDIGRTDGDLLSASYPARAIRTDRWLYVRNFEPDRWPVGNPEYDFPNCDGSPTKSYLNALEPGHADYDFFQLCFGKRPGEELYDITTDPDCVNNLASELEHRDTAQALAERMLATLTEQKDPRVLGQGEIFDYYPNCRVGRQQALYGVEGWDPVEIFRRRYPEKAVDLPAEISGN